MSSSQDSFPGYSDSREPEQELYSPFLDEALFVDEEAEADQAWETRLMALQSPFLEASEEEYKTHLDLEAEEESEEFVDYPDEEEIDQEELDDEDRFFGGINREDVVGEFYSEEFSNELEGLEEEDYSDFEDELNEDEILSYEEAMIEELFSESENVYNYSEAEELEDEDLSLEEEQFFYDLKRLWSKERNKKKSPTTLISRMLFLLWYGTYSAQKKYLEDEPRNNIDQFPFPYWIKLKDFFNEFRKKYGAEANLIIGDLSKKVTAQYFVIHDTAVAADFSSKRIRKRTNGIHLWINAENDSVRDKDWEKKGLGTKIERKWNNCFLHVEVTRSKPKFDRVKKKLLARKAAKIRGKKFRVTNKLLVSKLIEAADGVRNFGTYYTDKQYELLAYAYLTACIRKGSLLTITIHREVDRSVVRFNTKKGRWQYGHDDPQFFDISYFYSVISRLLNIPGKVTYGIQEDRVLALGQGNRSGWVNEFIPYVSGDVASANQYRPLKKLKVTKYPTIKLKYGSYYRADKLKVKFTC